MAVTRKYKVKIRPLKVELEVDDFDKENEESRKVKMMTIEVKWKGESKFGLVQFYKYKKDFTSRRFMKDNCVKWDNDADEFENVCCFTENQSLKKYSAWDVTFNVLYATNFQKMMLIGKVVVNVAELGARRMCFVQEKVPITLNIGKTSISAMLHVSFISSSSSLSTSIQKSILVRLINLLAYNFNLNNYFFLLTRFVFSTIEIQFFDYFLGQNYLKCVIKVRVLTRFHNRISFIFIIHQTFKLFFFFDKSNI